MRQNIPVLLLLAMSSAACTAGPASESSYDVAALTEEVTEALNGLTEAMNAHDKDAIFSFYRQDESFFYLGCTDILSGWATFAVRVGPYYDINDEVIFEREVLSVQILSANSAVAALSGRSTEVEGLFWTHALQKGDSGRWLITYEHESWPGCSVPRGPHMGTEGMGGIQMPGGDPPATPTSPGAH